MAQSLENPILNSPFRMPSRHWELGEKGMPTGQWTDGRRQSAYIVPIPQSKRVAGQTEFAYDIEGAAAFKANDLVNRIRDQVDSWRALGAAQSGVTYGPAACSLTGARRRASARCSSAKSRQPKRSSG